MTGQRWNDSEERRLWISRRIGSGVVVQRNLTVLE